MQGLPPCTCLEPALLSGAVLHCCLPLQLLSLGIPLGLGQLVGLATMPAVLNWYIPKLRKPSWAPPAPVFGQVGCNQGHTVGQGRLRAASQQPNSCGCCCQSAQQLQSVQGLGRTSLPPQRLRA